MANTIPALFSDYKATVKTTITFDQLLAHPVGGNLLRRLLPVTFDHGALQTDAANSSALVVECHVDEKKCMTSSYLSRMVELAWRAPFAKFALNLRTDEADAPPMFFDVYVGGECQEQEESLKPFVHTALLLRGYLFHSALKSP